MRTPALPFCQVRLSARKPSPRVVLQEPRTWGEHLRRQRILRGLLQKEVANEIGVCPDTVLNWEANRNTPPVHLLPRITTFLRYCPWTAPQTPGERFRQVRVGLGLTQKAAAALLGVDPATVTRWESGQRRPPAGYRQRLLVLRAARDSPCGIAVLDHTKSMPR